MSPPDVPAPRAGGSTRSAGMPVPTRTWRPRRAQAVTMGVAAAVLVGCVVCWIAFPPEIRATFSPAQSATLVLVLGFLVASLVAYSRCSVRVEPTVLVLHNVWRRRRIPWAEVHGLRYRHDDPWPMVLLAGERRVGVMGIQTADGPRARLDAAELAAAMRPHLSGAARRSPLDQSPLDQPPGDR